MNRFDKVKEKTGSVSAVIRIRNEYARNIDLLVQMKASSGFNDLGYAQPQIHRFSRFL